MKTGRARILEMVKDGKISIEQADELLEALENAQPNTPARTSPFEASQFEPEHKPRAEVRIPRSTNGGKYNFEQMIELGKFGVSPKFIRQIAEVGLTDLSFEDVIELGKFGISPKFVLEMRQLSEEFDLGELNFERIIELGKFGVSSKFVREMIETQMIDFTLPPSQWPHHETHDDERRTKLQAKLEKAQVKLSQAKTDREREKLEEIIEEVTDELEALEIDAQDRLEAQLEAELERETVHDIRVDSEHREKLQARLDTARAKLSQVKTEHERKTLEVIIDKVTEKLERKLSQVKTEHERETLEKITEKVVEEIERKLSQVNSTQS
jgi:hypothetical protein